jgi:hypothetical protein
MTKSVLRLLELSEGLRSTRMGLYFPKRFTRHLKNDARPDDVYQFGSEEIRGEIVTQVF